MGGGKFQSVTPKGRESEEKYGLFSTRVPNSRKQFEPNNVLYTIRCHIREWYVW